MTDSLAEDATLQIKSVLLECVSIFDSLDEFCPIGEDDHYPETFRLLATPMFYSIWERCFTTCHAVTLRLLKDQAQKASDLAPYQRTAWLLRTPFYQSFCNQLKQGNFSTESPKTKRIKKGQFAITAEFITSLQKWSNAPIDSGIDANEIVMTFSNINPDVVKLNAQAIGINSFEGFKKLKLGRLHNLVDIRNSIGHGAFISPPSNDEFLQLWNFTECLVNDYCKTFISWIKCQSNEVLAT